MSTKYDNVIIFGPTGNVGSVAALEASRRGAKVWLAMRDTTKPIKGLSKEQEEQGSFERIKADLTDAASVTAAIKQSGVKAAYMYLVATRSGLGDTIAAMKEAGIEYVVFLSSSTLGLKDVRSIKFEEEIIAFAHAQIEIALEDNGIDFVALRPGFFASNAFSHNLDMSKTPWEATMMPNKGKFDNISPLDMGRVAGSILVDRPSSSSKEIIFLRGPQFLTQEEMWDTIQKVSSHEIKINLLPSNEYREHLKSKGVPPPIANHLVHKLETIDGYTDFPKEKFDEGLANIEKYSGHKAQTYSEFLADQDI